MRKYRHNTGDPDNLRIYGIWQKMKSRCFNERCERYKDYGGRGITMCEEWASDFDAFADWAYANGYESDLTIDRTNNDGNYEPNNCRWITRREQAYNTRQNRLVTYRGETKPLIVWCNELNLPYDATHNRIEGGWDVERAFTEPLFDQTKSWSRKCREHGINPATARDRIVKFGWTEEQALNTPSAGRGSRPRDNDPLKYGKAECEYCGKQFIKNMPIMRFCSGECRETAKKLRRKAV